MILLLGAVIGVVATRLFDQHNPPRVSTPPSRAPSDTTASGAAAVVQLTSESPANGSTAAAGTTPIVLDFSAPLASNSPLPSLSPPTAGTWVRGGATLTFTPTEGFLPLSVVTVTVPTGPTGVVSDSGGHLAAPATEQFHVANGSVIRLQQLLSLLDYSPLAWTPTVPTSSSDDSAVQVTDLFSPPAGRFTWRDRGWPHRLLAMWHEGADNTFTRGLVMSFQADHGLNPNGAITPGLWSSLLSAVSAGALNTGGYNYALANKAAPESLTIYHNGTVALKSPANTGVADSPTPDGTFPVNTRLRRQIMRGTNPNGQKYADLVQYIAYFHGNDAVHYMDRADYGIPQSLGCVELPLADAAKAWPYLAYGTLVTVIN